MIVELDGSIASPTSTSLVLTRPSEGDGPELIEPPYRAAPVFDPARASYLLALARAARAFADTLEDEIQAIPPAASPLAPLALPAPSPAAVVAPRSDYMTAAEYAAHRRVSRTTVFGWIRRGLPSSKQGGTRRISWREADTFLDSGALSSAQHKPARRTKKMERSAA